MQITFNENELREAVVVYIEKILGKTVDPSVIDFTAGRGTNGITTTIDLDREANSKSKSCVASSDNGNEYSKPDSLSSDSIQEKEEGETEDTKSTETTEEPAEEVIPSDNPFM